jgi:hypothetical protein
VKAQLVTTQTLRLVPEAQPIVHDNILWTGWLSLEDTCINTNGARLLWHPKVSIDKEIDKEASESNVARFGHALNLNTISTLTESYKQALANRMVLELPALAGYRPTPGGMLVLADGNNRTEFCRRNRIKHAALYEIIGATPSALDTIIRTLNGNVGDCSKAEEKFRHALEHLRQPENQHETIESVAKKFRIVDQQRRLAEQLAIVNKRYKLASNAMQVPHSERLKDGVLLLLCKAEFHDPVEHAIASGFASFLSIPGKEAKAVIDEVKKARSEKAQLATTSEQIASLIEKYGLGNHIKPERPSSTLYARTKGEIHRFANFAREWDTNINLFDVITNEKERVQIVNELQAIKKGANRLMKGVKV